MTLCCIVKMEVAWTSVMYPITALHGITTQRTLTWNISAVKASKPDYLTIWNKMTTHYFK